MAKASIIIPAYNNGKYLPDCLNSILEQSYDDYEIVLVDDGSSDNTGEIADKYAKEYPDKIKYFYQQNSGPGAARNRGIQEAKGDYLAFLDADDILLENSLEERMAFLEIHSEVSMVFSDYNIGIDKKENKLSFLKQNNFLGFFKDTVHLNEAGKIIFSPEFYYKYLEFSPLPVWTGTVLLKKEAFRQSGFFRTDIFVGEDVDFWLRCIKNKFIGYIDKPLAVYRHNLSLLTKDQEKGELDRIQLYKDIYEHNPENRIRRILRKRLAVSHYSLGYYYKNNKRLDKAKFYLLQSIRLNPFGFKPYKSLLAASLLNSNKYGKS